MKIKHLLLLMIALLALTGCTQTLAADETGITPRPKVDFTPTPTAASTSRPTVTTSPSPTAVSSTRPPSPLPPTLTAVPTTSPTPTETAVSLPSPTPSPTPVAACRPAADTTPHIAIPLGPWPRPGASTTVIHHGPYDAERKLIHLSFDVEGDGRILGSLLNVLDKHSVKTTFFIVGSWAEANSYWLTEAAQRGHEFANHTYTHTHLRQLTPEQIQTELEQTETAVMTLTGKTTKPWLRPPYGGYSEATVQAAYRAGWSTIMWSGTGMDTDPEANDITICNTLMQYAEPGAILLLHTSNPAVVTAVDRFITEMNAQGYTFVPLSVLLGG